ncbi:MAG TPA: sucrase ferredoxin [Rubrobacter sp.]|nr:sucrase ferredoxin [Rubrobacter sp.]
MKNETPSERRLCSLVSKASGEDPIGSATPFETCLMVESAQPWARRVAGSRRFPEGLPGILEAASERGQLGKLTALLPDREYSRAGHTRLLFWRRPPGPFAAYEKDDLLVPKGEVVPAVEALLAGPDGTSSLARYRQDTGSVREVVVCTHGSRDVCCGKFGYPVYDLLRRRHAARGRLRVWRTSHIGGHRFSPTLLELPEGRYWGHLEPGAAGDLVTRGRPPSGLARFYRGWAGLGSPYEQIAEREILTREGWGWSGYLKEGEVLRTDGSGDRAEVRIGYRSPDGSIAGAYEAVVEADDTVMTLANSGTDPLEEVTQYRVVRLEKVS